MLLWDNEFYIFMSLGFAAFFLPSGEKKNILVTLIIKKFSTGDFCICLNTYVLLVIHIDNKLMSRVGTVVRLDLIFYTPTFEWRTDVFAKNSLKCKDIKLIKWTCSELFYSLSTTLLMLV